MHRHVVSQGCRPGPTALLLAMTALLVSGCGGSAPAPSEPEPGQSTSGGPAPTDDDANARAAEEARRAAGEAADRESRARAAAALPSPSMTPSVTPAASPATTGGLTSPARYAFSLVNQGPTELVFAIDKGWQPVVFAYTGKPPKAKPVILFAKFNTASCELPPAEQCPKKPAGSADPDPAAEKAETRRAVAAPGAPVAVPWSGKVLVYEKVKGKRGCECFREADPPAEPVTVKACGLRRAAQVGKPSRPSCTETQVTFPLAQTDVTLTFER